MSHFIHQDKMMWSRTQTLSAIQVAALAASYAVRSANWLSLVIMGVALFLTILVYAIAWRDSKDAFVNSELMDKIGNEIITEDFYRKNGRVVSLTSGIPIVSLCGMKLNGFKAITIVFCLFGLVNIFMIIVYAAFPNWLPD